MDGQAVKIEDILSELQKRLGTVISTYEYQITFMTLSFNAALARRDEKIAELEGLIQTLTGGAE